MPNTTISMESDLCANIPRGSLAWLPGRTSSVTSIHGGCGNDVSVPCVCFEMHLYFMKNTSWVRIFLHWEVFEVWFWLFGLFEMFSVPLLLRFLPFLSFANTDCPFFVVVLLHITFDIDSNSPLYLYLKLSVRKVYWISVNNHTTAGASAHIPQPFIQHIYRKCTGGEEHTTRRNEESQIFGNNRFIHFMHNPNIANQLENRQSENV